MLRIDDNLRMLALYVIELLFLILGIMGCGQLADNSADAKRGEDKLPIPTGVPPTPTVDLSGILELSLELPSHVEHGERVPLKLRLKNVSTQPVELGLMGREDFGFAGAYDFVITKPGGTKVWRWLEAKVLLPILSRKTLNPGQEMIFVAEWSQVDAEGKPVPPGTYHVVGSFNGGGHTPILKTQAQPVVISAQSSQRQDNRYL